MLPSKRFLNVGSLCAVAFCLFISACGSDGSATSETPAPARQEDKDTQGPGAKKKPDAKGDEGKDEKKDDGERDRASFGARLAKNYMRDYASIASAVGFTTNACSAFASTALRRNGVKVPYEQWAPSLVDHLRKAGWKKIESSSTLLPGDVVFTHDAQTAVDGTTDHVYVFIGYKNGKKSARAIDNQNNDYERNLAPGGGFSPFWFAFRHP